MSGSWDSSRRRETLLVLAAFLALGLGPASVSARTYARATVQDDSGQVVGRVRISSDGVEVTRLRGDSSSVSVADDDDTDIVVDTRGAGLVRLFSDAVLDDEIGQRAHCLGFFCFE